MQLGAGNIVHHDKTFAVKLFCSEAHFIQIFRSSILTQYGTAQYCCVRQRALCNIANPAN
jgi:hypothetical protein